MPIVLNNTDQERCITPAEAVEAVADGYRAWARGDAARRGATMTILPTLRPDEVLKFFTMEGGLRAPGYFAFRMQPQVGSTPGGARMQYTYQPGYDRARELGLGTALPRELFLQDDWTYSPGAWREPARSPA